MTNTSSSVTQPQFSNRLHSYSYPNSNKSEFSCFKINPIHLPKEIWNKITDFAIPKNYLDYFQEFKGGICAVSKAFKNIEIDILQSRAGDIQQIIRNVKGDIGKLKKNVRQELQEIGHSVKSLDLTGLQCSDPEALQSLVQCFPNLATFTISFYTINNIGFKKIAELKKLKQLSIRGNFSVTAMGFTYLSTLPVLEVLALHSKSLVDATLTEIAKYKMI